MVASPRRSATGSSTEIAKFSSNYGSSVDHTLCGHARAKPARAACSGCWPHDGEVAGGAILFSGLVFADLGRRWSSGGATDDDIGFAGSGRRRWSALTILAAHSRARGLGGTMQLDLPRSAWSAQRPRAARFDGEVAGGAVADSVLVISGSGRRWSSGDSMVRSPAAGAIDDDDDDVGFGERRRWWRRRVAQLRGHRQRSPNSPAITVAALTILSVVTRARNLLGPPAVAAGRTMVRSPAAPFFLADWCSQIRGDDGARAVRPMMTSASPGRDGGDGRR